MRSLLSRCLHRWWNNFCQCLIIYPHFHFLAWKVDRLILTYRLLRSVIYLRAVQWFPVGKLTIHCVSQRHKITNILLLNLIGFFIAKVIDIYFNQFKIWRWISKFFIFLSGLASTKCGVDLFKPLPVHTIIYTMKKDHKERFLLQFLCYVFCISIYMLPFPFSVWFHFCCSRFFRLVGWFVDLVFVLFWNSLNLYPRFT